MTHDEILQGLYDHTLVGHAPEVRELVEQGLADDLGVNVAPETFVAKVKEHEPDIVGFSAFLTTTMPMFKANINALEKAGVRDDVIVMVGGAPVTQEYADAVGADGYSADASSAVKKAKALIEERRASVPA